MEIKERITEGAAELFKTYGIKSVTMDTLASHLGMSKRTIYEVFSDKDELLMEVLASMAVKQRGLVKRILEESDNSIVAIFRLLEINREHFQDMSPVFMADLKKYHHDVLMKKTDKCDMPDFSNNIEVIERGIKERWFRADINADLVNRCLFSLGKSIMDQDLYPYEQFTRKEVISNTFINYLKGVSTPEGIELINALEAKF
jgi:AcrR family transcriptional regulator